LELELGVSDLLSVCADVDRRLFPAPINETFAMTLYHGSNIIVERPDLRFSVRALDFGRGFYTTTEKRQAVNFAKKVRERALRTGDNATGCFVSIYEFDEAALVSGIAVRRFATPDEEWFDFVMANRREEIPGGTDDIIIGPVANDTVYRTLIGFEAGLYSKRRAIQLLRARKLCDQWTFTSEKSLGLLRFAGSMEVTP